MLFNANWATFQSYNGENQKYSYIIIFIFYYDNVCFVLDNTLGSIFKVLGHWNNYPRIDTFLHSDTLSWFRAFALTPWYCVLSRDLSSKYQFYNSFVLNDRLEHTIYRTLLDHDHANHYTTDAVRMYDFIDNRTSLSVIIQLNIDMMNLFFSPFDNWI